MRRLVRYPQLAALTLFLGLLSLAFASPLLGSLAREGIASVLANYSGDGWGNRFFEAQSLPSLRPPFAFQPHLFLPFSQENVHGLSMDVSLS